MYQKSHSHCFNIRCILAYAGSLHPCGKDTVTRMTRPSEVKKLPKAHRQGRNGSINSRALTNCCMTESQEHHNHRQ